MPVLHHDQQERKRRPGRWWAWLLVLPGLLLTALIVPVFAPVQLRVNGAEWTAASMWLHASGTPQGVSSDRVTGLRPNPAYPATYIWILRLGDWHYQVYRSDLLSSRPSSGAWADRTWGIRFQPRWEPGEGE